MSKPTRQGALKEKIMCLNGHRNFEGIQAIQLERSYQTARSMVVK
jgi:hypothetical protein